VNRRFRAFFKSMAKVKETPQEAEARKKKEFEAALAKLQRVPNDVALVRHIQDSPPGPQEVLSSESVEAGIVAPAVRNNLTEPATTDVPLAEEPERARKFPTATVASPTVQVVFDQLEPQVRGFSIPARAKKRSVAVCEDVFSRVSRFSFASDGLDKGLILSFLLDRYIPKEIGQETSVARWLMRQPDREDRIRYLPFYEDVKLQRRLAGLKEFHGLSKVTLIENVVSQALPPSPHNVPPTRRRRV
jgi:hypothetical protein